MALSIQTTPAILAWNVTKPQQSIEQPKATVEGSLTLLKTKVEATLPKITIDQTQAFNESGLKTVRALGDEHVNFAKQKMQEGIGRRAQQGNQLAKISDHGNPISQQAAYNAYDQFLREFGMVTMPRSGPDIDVVEGQIDVQVTEGELTGNIRAQKPIVNYQQGRIERYMQRYNSITIQYEGDNVDLQV